MAVVEDDRSRSMRDESVRSHRRAMLWEPHIAPLTAYVATLRDRGMSEVPDFDPLDSGKDATCALLV